MQVKKGSINFNVEDGPFDNFWKSVSDNNWEPKTFDILRRFLDKEHSYVDIGAWIGPTVLYAAHIAKKCYAFEPDRVAFDLLKKNLELNPQLKNVTALPLAIADATGKRKLGTYSNFGDSMSSYLWEKDAEEVDTVSLPEAFHVFSEYDIDNCNLIKVDIEGGEFLLLPAARDFLRSSKASLYLSLHTPWFENKDKYFSAVIDGVSGYKNIYTMDEKKIELEDIRKLEGFSAIICTNI